MSLPNRPNPLDKSDANPTTILLGMLGFALFMGIVVRCVMIFPYPMGDGRWDESPDQKYVGHAYNMVDKGFWGETREFYQFQIRLKETDEVILSQEIPINKGDKTVHFRHNGFVMWSGDSKSVSFGTADNVLWQTKLD